MLDRCPMQDTSFTLDAHQTHASLRAGPASARRWVCANGHFSDMDAPVS